jgi:hypothetical protein
MNTKTLGIIKLQTLALIGGLLLAISLPAAAQDEYPYKQGSYWEVTGIHVNDGAALKYANHLATKWTSAMEYGRQQGWTKSYHVLSNEYPRKGEPDLYLIRIFDVMPDAAENEKRAKAWREHMKTTIKQLDDESGDRAEYRTVGSNVLLREMIIR